MKHFPYLVFSFLLLTLGTLCDAQPTPLRVACRRGQPPFIDAVYDVGTGTLTCSGMLYDMWLEVVKRTELNSSYVYFNGSAGALFSRMAVNSTTNRSTYDIGLSYSTISSDRMRTMDFSIPVVESQYVMGLTAAFRGHATSLSESIVRKSVVYLFTVLTLFMLLNTVSITVVESLVGNPEFVDKPWSARLCAALEASIEITLSGGSPIPLRSPVSRLVRLTTVLATLFVLTLFGALVTSRLTAGQLQEQTPTIDNIRWKRILISSLTLQPFLQSDRISAYAVDTQNLKDDMQKFYAGQLKGFDGYALPEGITRYYHNLLGGAANGFVLSAPFTEHGSSDLRAILLSRSLPLSIRDSINIAITKMRDEGYIKKLYDEYVPSSDAGAASADDIDIPESEFNAVSISAIVGFATLAAVILGAFIYEHLSDRSGSVSSVEVEPQQTNDKFTSDKVCVQIGTKQFLVTKPFSETISSILTTSSEAELADRAPPTP